MVIPLTKGGGVIIFVKNFLGLGDYPLFDKGIE